jgi:hypothetical protein
MCTTCFGLYLGNVQACQYKNLTKDVKFLSGFYMPVKTVQRFCIDMTEDGLSTGRNM